MKELKGKEAKPFNDFCHNLELLRKVFNLLEPGDQLRFASVTPQLGFVIRTYIWCTNFKHLQINKSYDMVRVKYGYSMEFDLSQQEFNYFLETFGLDVEELIESNGTALNIATHLPNLVTLKYKYLLLTNEHLHLIAESCSKLETLYIQSCCNRNRKLISLGSDIELETLLQMKNLKNFTLTSRSHYIQNCRFKNEYFKKISSLLGISNSLKFFKMYMPSLCEHMWVMFPNLQYLTISVAQNITTQEIEALASICLQLRQLTFTNCTFDDVKGFSGFKNLTDLSLYHCHGLTYDNLKEILTELKLHTYTSKHTNYSGIFHYYFVSPSMKSIFIDSVKSYKFLTASEYYKSRYDIKRL